MTYNIDWDYKKYYDMNRTKSLKMLGWLRSIDCEIETEYEIIHLIFKDEADAVLFKLLFPV